MIRKENQIPKPSHAIKIGIEHKWLLNKLLQSISSVNNVKYKPIQ